MTPRKTRSPRYAGIVAMAFVGLLASACATAAAQSPSDTPAKAAPAASAQATHLHTATTPSQAAAATEVAPATTTAEATATAAAPTAPTTAAPTVAPSVQTAPPATSAPTTQPVSGSVAVTLTDVAIRPDRSSTAAGTVTFVVRNVGTGIHQLVVLRTNIPQGQIPANPAQPGTVTEPGFVAQTPNINPGATASLTLTLGAGSYVLICNQPAHYLIGMHVAFTIN